MTEWIFKKLETERFRGTGLEINIYLVTLTLLLQGLELEGPFSSPHSPQEGSTHPHVAKRQPEGGSSASGSPVPPKP